MQIILEQVINILFLFFGNALRGKRTLIAGIIMGITGAIKLLSDLFNGLCEQFHALCIMANPTVVSVIMIWGSVSVIILKKLDQIEAKQRI